MINLIEIAIMAQENMRKDKAYIEGVKNAMEWLSDTKVYNGTAKQCILYINSKITLACNNCIDNPAYLGCIALYSAMIDVLYFIDKRENKK